MDILNSLRRNQLDRPYDENCAKQAGSMEGTSRPQTITELIDAQIGYHQTKINDLKAAKEAISPEVEKALNALAKIG